jgi:hypothetical protein
MVACWWPTMEVSGWVGGFVGVQCRIDKAVLERCLDLGYTWLLKAPKSLDQQRLKGLDYPNSSMHPFSTRKVQGHPLHNHGADHPEHIRAQ